MEQQTNCPQCGAPIVPGAAFCTGCGAAVAAPQQSEAAPQPNPAASSAQGAPSQ